MKRIIALIIAINSIFFISCEKEELFTEDAYEILYLRNNKADMPVSVKGNTSSRIFIIWLHGGPGDSSFPEKYGDQKINNLLEKDYANVYWDQRCAGSSTGNFDPDNLSIDIMVEDLEKLVTLIKYRYGNDISLYLLGHSWGGTLAYSYLLKPENQSQVDGFINISGPHYMMLRVEQQKEAYIELAQRQLNLGNNSIDWQAGINKFENLDLSNPDNWSQLAPEIPDALEYLEKTDSIISSDQSFFSVNAIFGTPSIEMVIKNLKLTVKTPLIDELEDLNLTTDLSTIQLPVLLCSGHFDLTVTESQLNVAYDLIGSLMKQHKVFNHSAHYSHISEPDEMYNTIYQFINNSK